MISQRSPAVPDPHAWRAARSLLIVPAHDEAAVARALQSAADALVFDLTDAPANATEASCARIAEALRGERRRKRLIAIDPLGSARAERGLSALCRFAPDGVVLPRAETAADVQHLGTLIAVEEARAGLVDGSIAIVPVAETGAALFELIAIARASKRVAALVWDGEALARDIGAEAAREADGDWCDPCRTARLLALAACADARLPVIDARFTGADERAFAREAEAARKNGFSGKVALDVGQAEAVNATFPRP